MRAGAIEVSRASRGARYLAAWMAAALPAFLIITLLWLYPGRTNEFGFVALGILALAFPVMLRRIGVPRRIDFVYFLLAAGVAFGILSVLTGWGNGLTDEPFTTPRFAAFTLAGNDPYTTQLIFTYQQYGRTLSSQSYYLYLPLLMFLQIPFVNYKWFTLGCWVAMVLLVRRRFDAATMLAQPYVLLVAASGYNDLPVLLLLTLGFAGIEGKRQKWAEYLSLGCKQFANAFVFVYYLVRRRWVDSLITIGVTFAFLAPFLVWGGTAVLCPAVLADRLSQCTKGGSASLLLNYPVWLVWIFAIFYLPLLALARGWADRPGIARRLARSRIDRTRVAGLPALAVVSASAVLFGLVILDALMVPFGTSGRGALLAGLVAIVAAAIWWRAWNGPWRVDRGAAKGGTDARTWILISTLVSVAVALPVLDLWLLANGPALPGLALALSLGIGIGSALTWRWRLIAPPSSDRRTEGRAREHVG